MTAAQQPLQSAAGGNDGFLATLANSVGRGLGNVVETVLPNWANAQLYDGQVPYGYSPVYNPRGSGVTTTQGYYAANGQWIPAPRGSAPPPLTIWQTIFGRGDDPWLRPGDVIDGPGGGTWKNPDAVLGMNLDAKTLLLIAGGIGAAALIIWKL